MGPPRVSTARAPLGSRKPGRPGATLYMERKNTKGGRRAGNNHSVGRVHRGSSRMERRLCEGGRRYRSLYSRTLAKGSVVVFFFAPRRGWRQCPNTMRGVGGSQAETYLPTQVAGGLLPLRPRDGRVPGNPRKLVAFPPFISPSHSAHPGRGEAALNRTPKAQHSNRYLHDVGHLDPGLF